MTAQKRPQLAVVFLFIDENLIENGDGAFVAQLLQLGSVHGNVAALVDLQAAQGIMNASGAVGQRAGFDGDPAVVSRLRAAQLHNALAPQRGVFELGLGQMAQHLGAHRFHVLVRKALVGVVARHFGLPVAFEGRQDLFQLAAAQGFIRHCFLAFLRIRHFLRIRNSPVPRVAGHSACPVCCYRRHFHGVGSPV